MTKLAVRRLGNGPSVLLVHGGLAPEPTWNGQESLADRWELVIPWRRGFGESPPSELIDFDDDADDLGELFGDGVHLAAFSYGGNGAAIAAVRDPQRIRSVTLIEPSLFAAAAGNPDVEELRNLSEKFIFGRANTGERNRFLEISGVPPTDEAALAIVDGQIGPLRNPAEADPDLSVLRDAKIPVLVVSGGHQPSIEAVCDAVAEKSGGERLVYEGAGHAAHKAPGFNARFEAFMRAA